MTRAVSPGLSRIAALSGHAFQAFCDDMTDMFGVNVRCESRKADIQTAGGLLGHFKKLTAVHLVKSEGTLNGTFHLLFDQRGLFVLSGVFVMLAESQILEQAERGATEDVEYLEDATREVGSMLVGSWDRVFRNECDGHKHLFKARTFIGRPWDDPGEIGFQADMDVFVGLYEMTVEPYPSFDCAVIFPTIMLDGMESRRPLPRVEVPPVADVDARDPADDEMPVPRVKVRDTHLRSASAAAAEPPSETVPTERQDDSTQKTVGAKEETADVSTADAPGFSSMDASCIESSPRLQNGSLVELLRTPVAQIMERDVIWAEPDDAVRAVIAKMQQRNAGYVLVGRKGLLEGLVSSSNISGAVSLYLRPMFAKWRRPQDDATLGVKIKWIMSHPVRTVRPDTTLAATIENMRRYGGRCLPVVDEQGAVQGIVTAFDVLLWILEADGSFSSSGRPPQAPALLL